MLLTVVVSAMALRLTVNNKIASGGSAETSDLRLAISARSWGLAASRRRTGPKWCAGQRRT